MYDTIPGINSENRFPPKVENTLGEHFRKNLSTHRDALVGSPNFDTIINNGVYPVATSTAENMPSTDYGNLIVLHPTGNRHIQIYITFTTPVKTFVRNAYALKWNAWNRIDNNYTWRGFISSGTDLNSIIENGTYLVNNNTTNQPVSDGGILHVVEFGVMVQQTFETIINDDTEKPIRYTRRVNKSGGSTPWQKITGDVVFHGFLTPNTDIDTIVKNGVYLINNNAVNQPTADVGILTVTEFGIMVQQTFETVINSNEELPNRYTRRVNKSGGSTPWIEEDWYYNNAAGSYIKHNMLRQRVAARKGGVIGTSGTGAIALRFDDAPEEFVERMLPILTRYNLPFTRVTTSDRIGNRMISESAFPEMERYSLTYGGEVWNHGATHGERKGIPDLTDEIIGSLHKLQRLMPKINVDCWTPPGGSQLLGGYMPGNTIDQHFGSVVGRMIFTNHGLVSGYLDNTYYRSLNGVPMDGQRHLSADAWGSSRIKSIVNRLISEKNGCVIMYHANNPDSTDRFTTMDEFEKSMAYIAEQRALGKIQVLTVSGMAFADKQRDRENLLNSTDGDSININLTSIHERTDLPGATMELSFDTTVPEFTVIVNEQVYSYTRSNHGRRFCVFTIPKDATKLSISANVAHTNAILTFV